jgi:hypothetical protein
MKKFSLCAFIMLASVTGFCQVSFGIKGGLNLAHQKISVNANGVSASEAGSTLTAFQIGAFADIKLDQNLSFIPELLLSREGSDFNGSDFNGNAATENFRFYYLRVPLDLVYKTEINADAKFFFGAGLDFGFGLSGKISAGDSSMNAFQSDGFKKSDFGINFLTGVELKSGVRFSFSYYLGLSSIISDNASALTGYDAKWYNRAITFSVAYAFGRK